MTQALATQTANPLANLQFRSPRAVPATELRLGNSRERALGAGKHINASSKADLLGQIGKLIQASQSGMIAAEPEQVKSRTMVAQERTQILAKAYNEAVAGNPQAWRVLGSAIGAELSQAADRDGFMRRLLVPGDVSQGSIPRVRLKVKNVMGAQATGPSMLVNTIVRDNYFLPQEFYVKTNLRVEEREIAQGAGDILEDKFFEGNEAIMVQEDRTVKKLLDATISQYNDQQILAGGLSPTTLAAMRSSVTRWNIPAQTILMASDLWQDITGNSLFAQWMDPVSQYEIVQTGYLGQILGMGMITDAFRLPNLKVLNAGEIYVLGAPEMLGVYTSRGPVNANPVDSYLDGIPARGWSMWEIISMIVANGRAVVKGIRT